MEKFSPTVMIDGMTYTPTGWMWVLSFALAGVPWAVEQVTDATYDLRGKINDYMRRKYYYHIKFEIEDIERKLAKLKAQL